MSSGVVHVLSQVPEADSLQQAAHDHQEFNGTHTSSQVNGTTTPSSTYHLLEHSIDDPRPMKVIVIGAGYSGIIAGIQFPKHVKNLELTIYEAQDDVGGAWHANRYPGLACDIPAHCYQLTFELNPSWSSFFAPGPEIKAYLKSVSEKHSLSRYIKLSHRVNSAHYDASAGKWNLEILDIRTNTTFTDSADFVLSSTGGLSRWSWPDIEGLHSFKGELMHSARYESEMGLGLEGKVQEGEDLEKRVESEREKWGDKKVAVIGVGSSAIQIVPSLQKVCSRVTNFVRGKTWIATPFASKFLLERQPDGFNHLFTAAEIKQFEDDPEFYFEWRKELDSELNSVHGATLLGHPIQQGAVKAFRELMEQKLQKKPWIADHLMPDFPVACRRLTPGPGYLEALTEDNVEFVPTEIKCVNERGIELVDGQQHDFDAIVCATGFDTTFKPQIDIRGRNNLALAAARDPYPVAYLSMASRGFPNWFETLGPNSAVGSGSLLIMIEREVEYAMKVVKKLQKERYKSIEVKQEAVDDFDQYMTSYFPRTVYSQKCRSWYKMGKDEGRVVALWPGSCLHALHVFDEPRWEDYDYEPLDNGIRNRFYYLGNGWTEAERTGEGDRAPYILRGT